ncbi:unnamed protein product [Prorocentrum cordatum]|uniref:Uncharacterized protein n=1 Tax=Prorocentrum cordatum TaxID=2364126 RepID=A0ABN9T5J5_9DINO|nr:unnamed protein product [Polarella glacialis]
MVVHARLRWLRDQVVAGVAAHLTFGAAAIEGRGKVKVVLDPARPRTSPTARAVLLSALTSLEEQAGNAVVVDRGHRFSDGRTEVCFWLDFMLLVSMAMPMSVFLVLVQYMLLVSSAMPMPALVQFRLLVSTAMPMLAFLEFMLLVSTAMPMLAFRVLVQYMLLVSTAMPMPALVQFMLPVSTAMQRLAFLELMLLPRPSLVSPEVAILRLAVCLAPPRILVSWLPRGPCVEYLPQMRWRRLRSQQRGLTLESLCLYLSFLQ